MTAREYIERCKELGVPVGPEVLNYKEKKPGPEEPTGYEARLAYFRKEGLKKRAKREHTRLPAHPSEPTGFVPLYRSTTMPQNGTLYSMGVEGRLSRLERNLKDKSPEERTEAAAEAFSTVEHTPPSIRRVGTCFYLYDGSKLERIIGQLVVPPLTTAREVSRTIPHDFFTQNVLKVPKSFASDLPEDVMDWHPNQRLFYRYPIETTKSYPREERGLRLLSAMWNTPEWDDGKVTHYRRLVLDEHGNAMRGDRDYLRRTGERYVYRTGDPIELPPAKGGPSAEMLTARAAEYAENQVFLDALKEDKHHREEKQRSEGISCAEEHGGTLHSHSKVESALACDDGDFYLVKGKETYRSYRRHAKLEDAPSTHGPPVVGAEDLDADVRYGILLLRVDEALAFCFPPALTAQAVGVPLSMVKARERRRRKINKLAKRLGENFESSRKRVEAKEKADFDLIKHEDYIHVPPDYLRVATESRERIEVPPIEVNLRLSRVKSMAKELGKPIKAVLPLFTPPRSDEDHQRLTLKRGADGRPPVERRMSDHQARKAASELQLPTGAPLPKWPPEVLKRLPDVKENHPPKKSCPTKESTLEFLGAKPVSFEARLPDGETVTLHAARNVESVRYGTLAMQTLNVLEDRKSWPEKLEELNKKAAKNMTNAEVNMWLAKRALYSPRGRAALNARKILAEVLRRRDKKARERLVEEGHAFPPNPPDDHDERVKTKSVPVALQLNADGTPLYALPEKLEAKAEDFVRVYPEAFARGIRPAILPPPSEACTQERNNGVVWYSGPSLYAFGKNSGTWPAGKTGMARERQTFYQSVRSKNDCGDVNDPTGEDALEDVAALNAELDAIEDERLAADAPEVEPEAERADNEVVESYDEAYDEGEEAPTGAELCCREWEEKIAPKLSEHELPAFLFAYVDGLSNGEIAERMGIAYDTARKLVLAAKHKVEEETGRKPPNRNRGKGTRKAAA